MKMIAAIDPSERTLRDIIVLRHMLSIATVIKGGIVGTQHIWNAMEVCSGRVTESIEPCGHRKRRLSYIN